MSMINVAYVWCCFCRCFLFIYLNAGLDELNFGPIFHFHFKSLTNHLAKIKARNVGITDYAHLWDY